MRDLTSEEIEKFATRKGVRRIAVENFLGSLGNADNKGDEMRNLYADAASYKWNSATVSAIRAGINLAYK